MQIKPLANRLLDETIGIPIEIKSNEFNEVAGNTYHRIVFQIKEEGKNKSGMQAICLPN